MFSLVISLMLMQQAAKQIDEDVRICTLSVMDDVQYVILIKCKFLVQLAIIECSLMKESFHDFQSFWSLFHVNA